MTITPLLMTSGTDLPAPLSFSNAHTLPRSAWQPPRHELMAVATPSATDLAHLTAEVEDMELAWAATERMGL